MRASVRGWRWRRNPLRRRSDVVEAWTALAVTLALVLGAPLLGALTGWWAHGQARAVQRAELADRHRVRAEVVGRTPDPPPSVQGGGRHTYRVAVRWSDADHRAHTLVARVPPGTRQGDTVGVWLDPGGRGVPPPPDETAVWQHTMALGACGACGAAAVVLLGRSLVGRVALRRRLAEWEREWARTGPRWSGRRT
ncbi:hypothetical protein ACF1B0_07045 [Streptomyces anandii]|uniref:Rv1733c family protein n=1 Tax=Streptomyces anandii TaxID=285454 RepID=UPI0036F7A92C